MTNEHDRPSVAPRRRSFGPFVHLKARFFQDYVKAIERASRRKLRKKRVDIDGQEDALGNMWGFHWATIGKNKYHDPRGIIKPNTLIRHLIPGEINHLRGPHGEKPHSWAYLFDLASTKGVEVEGEAKGQGSEAQARKLLNRPKVKRMLIRGDLVIKTLAFMGDPDGPINRLRPWHNAGAKTLLSFTGYRGPGIPRTGWPVIDYTRGKTKWR